MALDAKALSLALAKTPGASAEGLDTVHTLLCRREAASFQRAAKSGEDLLVACTQEARLFLELNAQTDGARPITERPVHFVNIRETGGWSRDGAQATPKIAALIAAAQLPPPEPVSTVSYSSAGRCLVIGGAEATERAAAMLADKLDVIQLIAGAGGRLPQARERAVHAGQLTGLKGWLGAFEAEWTSSNPIDLELCTRCNACINVCPEGAIDFSYQIDLAACKSHRDCVRVCDAAGAIDFERAPQVVTEVVDMVLDLREQPAFAMHQPPQGYFHVAGMAAGDEDAGVGGGAHRRLVEAVLQLREMTGEFEKPRFFQYRPKLCAHSRNQQIGCTACIDICSAQAIRSDATLKGKLTGKSRGAMPGAPAPGAPAGQGGGIVVEPHLCVGCGACTTVCPSGALTFGYPSPVDQGKRLRTLLTAYANAGGRDAALLIHSEDAGQRLIDQLGRAARTQGAAAGGKGPAAGPARAHIFGATGKAGAGLHGVPARVLPAAVWHSASTGIDLWLAAFAQGANQVWVLASGEEAPEYRRALREQMAVAQAIVSGLGYAGEHFKLIEAPAVRSAGEIRGAGDTGPDLAALDQALRAAPAQGVKQPAMFNAGADKRGTLDMVLDHLLTQAPRLAAVPAGASPVALAADAIALPKAGAPFGTLLVDTDKCTLCLSCVGACPESALADNPDKPQLKFIEKNCVQCGLCATTCPEAAITLVPRLWLADGGKARKAARVLHEVAPYCCIRCGKPFGTLRAIENMLSKLSGHSAFQGAAAERLKMCGDCRVIDIHTNPNEMRITDL